MVCDTNDFDSYSRDFKVYCYSTWKQTHVNPINSKQSWAFLWVACRTKCLVWDSSPYFPFAICSTSSNFAAASAYATARKQEPFIAHSKDSMAVNLMWCLLCMHPLLCWGAATEGFREVYGQKCRMHSAKAFPQPHLTACEQPHRLLLVKAPSLLHFYTVPLCWAIVFFKHSLTGRQRQRHSLSVLGESGDPRSSLGPRRTRGADGRRSMLPLTQPAWMLNCRTTERILICSNRMGVRRAASPASVNHSSPPEINAITPIFIDS